MTLVNAIRGVLQTGSRSQALSATGKMMSRAMHTHFSKQDLEKIDKLWSSIYIYGPFTSTNPAIEVYNFNRENAQGVKNLLKTTLGIGSGVTVMTLEKFEKVMGCNDTRIRAILCLAHLNGLVRGVTTSTPKITRMLYTQNTVGIYISRSKPYQGMLVTGDRTTTSKVDTLLQNCMYYKGHGGDSISYGVRDLDKIIVKAYLMDILGLVEKPISVEEFIKQKRLTPDQAHALLTLACLENIVDVVGQETFIKEIQYHEGSNMMVTVRQDFDKKDMINPK